MSRVQSGSARLPARAIATSPAVAGFRPAAAALAVAAVFAMHPAAVRAQPTGAQVIHGQASFAQNGNNLVVTTRNGAGSNHSAINWQSFSVPAGSITQFDQPSATSTSINRVVGPDPSAIFGTLRSNGRLVLVNPAGIAVGAGAVVDTSGFTASTLQMTEADAIAGRLRFFNDGASHPLTVDGTVRAQGGDVVLIAPDVQTAGPALVQSDGATVLAAGRKVEITGRGLEGIHLEVQAGDRAVNLGTLQGDAVGIFAGTLRHSGVVQAQALSVEGGKVVLKATGDNLVSGAVTAGAAGGKGGSIDVLGQRVGLLAGAALDASGTQGGGQVRVGGDYQGRNAAVANAAQTYVDAAATIRADATQQGDGGRVIVWSDEVTRMQGQVSARGGAQGGNGGFSEVSGKKNLEFTGRVDLRAPKGAAGTLLLDPEDLTIVHEAPWSTLGPRTDNISDLEAGIFRPADDGPATLTDRDLVTALGTGNVLVTTSRNPEAGTGGTLKVRSDADVTWATPMQLTLDAARNVVVDGTIRGTDGASGLRLQAGGDIAISAGALVSVGSLGMSAGGSVQIEAGNVEAFNGALGIDAGGLVGIASTGSGSTRLYGASSLTIAAAGDIRVGERHDYEVTPQVTIESGGLLKLRSNGGDMSFGELPVVVADLVQSGVPSQVFLNGHGVDLQAAGAVHFSPDTLVMTQQQAMSVIAGGDITGSGTFYSMGRLDPTSTDGAISLDAQGGSLHFRTVDSSAAGNPHAGTVTLHAKNDILGDQIAAIGSTFYAGEGVAPALAAIISTEGGSGSGGNGAAVNVTSESGSVAIGSIATYGGWSFGGSVGTVGSVTVTAKGLDPTTPGLVDNQFGLELPPASIAIGVIDAAGRWGSSGANGGTVTLAADHGSIAIGAIAAKGGDSFGAGVGGDGGTVSLTAASDIIVASQPRLTVAAFSETGSLPFGSGINASGGAGGTGGHGGAGGAITLQQAVGELAVGFGVTLDAGGGQGGSAAPDSTGAGGAGGTAGAVTLRAIAGGLWVGGEVRTSAGLGGTDGSGTVSAPAGGFGTLTLEAGGSIEVAGGWLDTYRTNVAGRAGGSIWMESPIATFGGSVSLGAGDTQLAAAAAPTESTAPATLDVLAGIDTRDQDSGLAAAVTLRAPGAVRLDAAPRVTVDQLATTSSTSSAGTIAGSAIDISAPQVTIAAGTALVSTQDTRITADTLALDGSVDSGTARTILDAFSSTRAIALGGTDEANTLNLTQDELDHVHAGALSIGSVNSSGGITVAAPVTVAESQVPALSLVSGGAIRQAPGGVLTVGSLEAIGGSVVLDQANIAHALSGRSSTGAFQVDNRASGTLEIGHIAGLADTSPVRVTTKGRLRVASPLSSAATGDAVVLSASSLDYAAEGNAIATPNGRWLVYLPTPEGSQLTNALGRLDSGNFALWNRSFGQAVPETGNRYVFSVQPLLDAITVLSRTKVYDGTLLPPAVSVTGTLVDAARYGSVFKQDVIGGELVVVGQSKNVGTYAVEQGTFGVAGYGVRSFTGGTVTITPRKLNVTLSAQDKVYDGSTAASFSFGDDRVAGDSLTLTGTAAFVDKNAGTGKRVQGTLTALGGADAGNYTVASPAVTTQASIARRTLNLSLAAQDKIYDGSTDAVVTTGDDRVAGDLLTLFVAGRFADKNAGSGKQVTVDATVAGADAGNYLVTLPANLPTASIARRALNVSATAQGKVYDGSTAASVALADDRVAGDVLAFGATASFADKNAGTGKLVNVQLTDLAGADAGNYVLAAQPAASRADITPAALNIAARDAFKFEGDALAFNGSEFTATGLVAGETIASVTLASAGADAGARADQYAITAGAPVGGSGFLPSNYRITFQDGLLTVLSPQTSPAAVQLNNQVVAFAQLFVQEALRQGSGDLPRGKDDIVVTDTACKP